MDQPIAIIGLDARFPGDADTAANFYDLLLAGRSARERVPPERYNVDAFWHPDVERAGATRTKYGHFLKDSVSAFDVPFFAMTAAEAEQLDPQQRGMMVTAYRALENAGIAVSAAAGTQTGVYIGCFTSDHVGLMSRDIDVPQKFAGVGTTASLLSNRVSWFFDLKGPSLTVDTACSSSLVATHQACTSLKTGEISMAVVGGCNLILSPEMTLKLDAGGVLSPDGISYSFDHRANGYSRGEGFGAIILKRVSDAIRDGDTIRAIIRSTGVNQDGKSPGLTQPTQEAQADLIRSVYSRASLDLSLTRFFEAHGTGTIIGDSIEASAISEIFTPHRSPESPLYVGALKSNVGHLEGAAGVASIIKGVLTLEKGIIPANAWFEKPNPKISNSWYLEFPSRAVCWPQHGLRRMSLNSFGIGGTNAHMVLDDAYHYLKQHHLTGIHRTIPSPDPEAIPISGNSTEDSGDSTDEMSNSSVSLVDTPDSSTVQEDIDASQIFIVSSFDQNGVTRQQTLYSEHLSAVSKARHSPPEKYRFLSDLGYTLAAKRTQHRWRSFALAKSSASPQSVFTTLSTPIKCLTQPQLAFVFTGQGSQWATMGSDLMAYPVFQQSLLDAGKYMNSLGSLWSLVYELCKETSTSRLDDPEFCQPICTALQVALVDLLATWNILPQTIIGHSSGEIAAAYAAGAISRESAWTIAFHRGRLCSALIRDSASAKTGMAAVGVDKENTLNAIERVNNNSESTGTLEIACFNSYNSQTVSGELHKIGSLVEILQAEGKFARKLNVEIAYHSRYLESLRDDYRKSIGQIHEGNPFSSVQPRFYSSTFGKLTSFANLQSPEYWITNLVSSVRFCEAATAMFQETGAGEVKQITDILEIGPHATLKGPLKNILEHLDLHKSVQYSSVIRRKEPATETALQSAATLYCRGHNADIPKINQTASPHGYVPAMLTDLPGYAFDDSKEYQTNNRLSKAYRSPKAVRHELLGAPSPDWNKDNAIWRNWIRVSENPWLEDHKVSGNTLYPAAGMLVMAIEASRQLADQDKELGAFKFTDVSFHHALQIPEDALGVESHFYLKPFKENKLSTFSEWNEFQLFTMQGDDWKEHCRGLVKTEYIIVQDVFGDDPNIILDERCQQDVLEAQRSCTASLSQKEIYRAFWDIGLEFGTTFQTLESASIGTAFKAVAVVKTPTSRLRECMPKGYLQPHLIHPATLDGVLQANALQLVLGAAQTKEAWVPVSVNELWVSARSAEPDASFIVASEISTQSRQQTSLNFTSILEGSGSALAYAKGLVCQVVAGGIVEDSNTETQGSSYNFDWQPDTAFLTQDDAEKVFSTGKDATASPQESYDECDLLCLLYMRRFLELGLTKNFDDLDSHFQKFFSWMVESVENSPADLASYNIAEIEAKVVARDTPEGRLILAVGLHLSGILEGTVDALEILFRDQGLSNFYRYGLGTTQCYENICQYLDFLTHKNPSLDILEIGAGTGGVTTPILETLTRRGQRYHQYHFTDISPMFFEQAREVFETQLGSMKFDVLDIERSPADQGFAEKSYDLIVAANVLHATKRIEDTLRNVRSLLRPGGKLVLFELTQPKSILCTFIVGLLPGWWLSEDTGRSTSPLITVESWNGHLEATQFSGVDITVTEHLDSVLISTAAEASRTIQTRSPVSLFAVNDGASQTTVAKGITDGIGNHRPISTSGILEPDVALRVSDTSIVLAELDSPLLANISHDSLENIKSIIGNSETVIWLSRSGETGTRAPHQELLTGLARTVRCEKPDLKFVTIAFGQDDDLDSIIKNTLQILHHVEDQGSSENTFRVMDGLVHIPRLVRAEYLAEHIATLAGSPAKPVLEPFNAENRALSLRISTTGILDTLCFDSDAQFELPLQANEVEIKVKACGINFHDLTVLLGKIQKSTLGLEASGVVTRVGSAGKFKPGDEVFGLFLNGCMGTYARTDEGFLVGKPPSLSWDKAASLPVVTTTAYMVLFETGIVQDRDTVLIHSAAGGLGQILIQMALKQGAEVFATVGSHQKRDFLAETYDIPRSHIFSSRDLAFKSHIMGMTHSRGVDLVLNTLSGEGLKASWDCVAPFGRFVELGMGDVFANSRIPMENLNRNTRLESFDLTYFMRHGPKRAYKVFQRAISHVLSDTTRLLKTPTSIYPLSKVEEAFRQLQLGKHIGKMVLELNDEDIVSAIPAKKSASQVRADATYVITGGFGGLGRSVARWMASQGARNLVILSRSGPDSEAAKQLVTELQETCENIATPTCDISDCEALREVMAQCLSIMPPVKGCIQGAMVLQDNLFDDMTLEDWNTPLRSKVDGSVNLIDVLGAELDFFIMLSSIASVTGSRAQSNYAAGNSFQDAFARHLQQSLNLNAVSLSCPAIEDVGFVAEKPELMDTLRSSGFSFMNERQFHASLDYHCRPDPELRKQGKFHAIPRLWLPQYYADEGAQLPGWQNDPLFSHLAQTKRETRQTEKSQDVKYAALIASAASFSAVEQFALDALLSKLSKVLSIDVSQLEATTPLQAYGVDSLVAVELRSWFYKELGAELSIFEMTKSSSIAHLASTAAKRSRFLPAFEAVASETPKMGA